MENQVWNNRPSLIGRKFKIIKWSILEQDYGSDKVTQLKKLGGIITLKFQVSQTMFYIEEVPNVSILFKEVEPVHMNEWQGGTRIRKVDYEQV